MSQPRATVITNESERKQPPRPHSDEINDRKQSGGRAKQMQQTCSGPAVLSDIKRPELRKRLITPFAHLILLEERVQLRFTQRFDAHQLQVLVDMFDAAHAD